MNRLPLYILLFISVVSCTRDIDTEKKISKKSEAYNELQFKYSAVDFFELDSLAIEVGFTYIIQETIKTKNLLFVGDLSDIYIKDGQYRALFDVPMGFVDYKIDLQMNDSITEKILSSHPVIFDSFIIVADIIEIIKPILKIDSYLYEEESYVELAGSEVLIMKGNIIDYFKIESD